MSDDKLDQLCFKLGYHFKDGGVLVEALTHSSYKKSGKSDYDNERYEFFGDRALNLILAEWFMMNRAEYNEGDLTLLMNGVHGSDTLSDIAYKLELHKYLFIDRALIGSSFKEQSSRIVAGALEALIGVMFLDGGYAAVKEIVLRLWKDKLQSLDIKVLKSAKARLQEYVQQEKLGLPVYNTLSQTGPAHSPTFEVEAFVEQVGKAKGSGSSKKQAEEGAALGVLGIIESKNTQ